MAGNARWAGQCVEWPRIFSSGSYCPDHSRYHWQKTPAQCQTSTADEAAVSRRMGGDTPGKRGPL